jgi:predicted nucleic acid-binding protein
LNYSAIIDNTALVYITQLHKKEPIFDKLRNILRTLYIPLAVKDEYQMGIRNEVEREWILSRLSLEQGFYRLCSTYDSVSLAFIKDIKGIDNGEAEAYAQYLKVQANFIISDDKAFISSITKQYPTVKIFSTIHLLVWLELAGFISDWNILINLLFGVRKFNSKQLREAYIDVSKILGINVDSKLLSKKCSLKAIILKN